MNHSHRHAGPKSTQYNELEKMINQYYEMLQKKRHEHANRFAVNIRKHILLHGCPEDDIIAETSDIKTSGSAQNGTPLQQQVQSPGDSANGPSGRRLLAKIGGALPNMRRVEDTLRGKLWRLVLGISNLDANDYKNQIKKAESRDYYVKIRGDTKRTFLTSEEYNSRVSEERLVRVLNSFVHRYNKPYCQGMDAIAAGLLYVMPELDAYSSFSLLINTHFPTYFYSDRTRKKDLIGAYAGSYLSLDILRICDAQMFHHLKALPAHTYFFPLVASFQAISQPFTELQRLWDFLFCFGVHLNPVLAAAQIIVNKKLVLAQAPARLLQGLLSQRKWMNQRLNARDVIDCAMHLIIILKHSKHKKIWESVAKHASNFEVALQVKIEHETGVTYKQITTANLSSNGASASNNNTHNSSNNHNGNKSANGHAHDHEDDINDDDIGDAGHDNDAQPSYKRAKTRSEENFGDFEGPNGIKEINTEDRDNDIFSSNEDDEDHKDD